MCKILLLRIPWLLSVGWWICTIVTVFRLQRTVLGLLERSTCLYPLCWSLSSANCNREQSKKLARSKQGRKHFGKLHETYSLARRHSFFAWEATKQTATQEKVLVYMKSVAFNTLTSELKPYCYASEGRCCFLFRLDLKLRDSFLVIGLHFN